MDYKDFNRRVNEAEGNMEHTYTPSLTFPVLMRKVYTWMALAMVITGITAFGVATSENLLMLILGNRIVFWGLLFAEFALVVALCARLNKLSVTTATLLFILYSVVNGATLSVVFLTYTLESIGQVFFITAGTFGVMALIGSTTKKDLTGIGSVCFMGLIGIIIASLVNFFIQSSAMQMVISYLGVLIFVGLTAYDSQKIKALLYNQDVNDEGTQKLAVLGALTLYLDFVNLFLYLIKIFGKRK